MDLGFFKTLSLNSNTSTFWCRNSLKISLLLVSYECLSCYRFEPRLMMLEYQREILFSGVHHLSNCYWKLTFEHSPLGFFCLISQSETPHLSLDRSRIQIIHMSQCLLWWSGTGNPSAVIWVRWWIWKVGVCEEEEGRRESGEERDKQM